MSIYFDNRFGTNREDVVGEDWSIYFDRRFGTSIDGEAESADGGGDLLRHPTRRPRWQSRDFWHNLYVWPELIGGISFPPF